MAVPVYESGSDEVVDLVIVGGGPTGLLSALLARRFGLSVSILDAKEGPLKLGRADALNARSQQYLEVAGLLDHLLTQGIKCNTSTVFAGGEFTSRQSHWWTGLPHTHHKNFLMVGQPVVEALLEKEVGSFVHYNEPAESFEETDSEVVVKTSKRTVRAKYGIAADGARSAVRTALDIGFAGTKPEMLWAVLDTFIDTDFPVCSEIITFQLNGQSRVAWIPRERGMARFYILLEGEITQENAEASIREHMAPHRVDFLHTEWFSQFDVKERIASTFISKNGSGRFILAGDAAHVHSVNGGQGLNTGIADAFNLAWRLGFALKGSGIEPSTVQKLLQSYDTERRNVCQNVIDVAAKLVRKTVQEAKDYVEVIEKNAAYITGMGVSYDGLESPIVVESSLGPFKGGHRCPDLYLVQAKKNFPRLYTILPYTKYMVLVIGKHQLPKAKISDLVDIITVQPYSGDNSDDSKDLPGQYQGPWVRDNDSYIAVVRPDTYVEFVGQLSDYKTHAKAVGLELLE